MLRKLFKKTPVEQTSNTELRFKTTLSCQGCVAAVTPFLEQIPDIEWSVDLSTPDRILIVRGAVDPQLVIAKLQEAGYQAELLSS